jgi:hypothetical protein
VPTAKLSELIGCNNRPDDVRAVRNLFDEVQMPELNWPSDAVNRMRDADFLVPVTCADEKPKYDCVEFRYSRTHSGIG